MSITLAKGGRLIGLGTDIVDVERIQRSHTKFQARFLNRIYTQDEQTYCLGMKNPYPHLAARFAAKEAVSKCFTTGIGERLGWKDIDIVKGQRGEPYVRLHGGGLDLLNEVGGTEVLVSLSHTALVGLAMAVIVSTH
ncbi:MAG: holo-ACP synthase [Opitutales bacterium]